MPVRTNRNGVTEKAEFNIDQEKFDENMDRIFGEPEKKFCDECGFRFSFCKCPKEENKEGPE